ncbi:MAG TPA: hypothetical protein VFT22_06535 [Kofleriaceae bacterium]|nr:hypothetical protein [Kofleriaceae bacterium]
MTATELKAIADKVARAMAAAGNDPWLVGYDANGIQELIAASGRPIAMRGASEAILQFDKEARGGELTIFAGGGRGVALARSREAADQLGRELVRRYRAITHGGVMASAAVPFRRGGDAEAQSIRWLRDRLEIAKDEALPPGGKLPASRETECTDCHSYHGTPRKRDEQIELVCARCLAMQDRGRHAISFGGGRREMSQSIAEIAEEGRIAVISADGNNLGALFESLGTLVELAVVSEVVANSFRTAQKFALSCVSENKRVPLLTGGDDVRAFIPPSAVLRYVRTLVDGVESAVAEHAQAARNLISRGTADRLAKIGIGVGAVIADVYYPAWRLVEHAHKLEDSAKAACRKHAWRSGFDFVIVTAEDQMTDKPDRALHCTNLLPLAMCTKRWQAALEIAGALAKLPPAQLALVSTASVMDDEHEPDAATNEPDRSQGSQISPEELGNLLCYQVARSREWQAWYAARGADWRDPKAVLEHRPKLDALQLARLIKVGGVSQ